jgi:methionyl aminopeptidase
LERYVIERSSSSRYTNICLFQLGREVLDAAASVIKVGVTTDEIDRVVHEACIQRECYPSPLNYHGFPKSCCT